MQKYKYTISQLVLENFLHDRDIKKSSNRSLTDHAGHDAADAVGEREEVRDGGGVEQAVGHLALRRHHRAVRAAQRHRRQPALVDRLQRVLCMLHNLSI